MKLKKPTFKISPGLFDTVYNLPLWQKIAILVVTWAVPLGLFWLLFLSPRLGELGTLSGKIPRLQREIMVLRAKEKKISELKSELKAMQGILQKAMKLLPEKKDIPSVLTEISSLGNAERLAFISFHPGKEQVMTFYAAIPVDMEISGPFHNTVSFFDKVVRMGRIVHLKDISMGNAMEGKQIWSQTANSDKSAGAGAAASDSTGTGGDASTGVVKSSLVIKTICRAEIYRFLTPEEQQAIRSKGKGRKGKRRR